MPTGENDGSAQIHASDPSAAPDDAFEPGKLHHLVPGNEGRLLDRRRTPVRVRGLELESGLAWIEIMGFEDAGAIWEVPFEDIGRFQFGRQAQHATELADIEAAVERFAQPLRIDVGPETPPQTAEDIDRVRKEAHSFFEQAGPIPHGIDLQTLRRSHLEDLQAAFRDFLGRKGLLSIEDAFMIPFVSNPHASETVRAHQVVLAELGLAPYDGKMLRRPEELEGAFDRPHRQRHILTRLGFLRALFDRSGLARVELFRGLWLEGPLEAIRPRTFVSTTFDRKVAESFFGQPGDAAEVALLYRQKVPIERLFATHLETRAMDSGPFRESEAVLLSDPQNAAF
jgi:hypothetical protein